MKEKVLEAFRELGFLLEQVEETELYNFNYEGMNFIYLPNKDDEEFLSISIPGIYDLEEDNIAKFVAITEKINSATKYVKAYNLNNSIWLFYEREILGEEDFKLVLSRMIMRLDTALLMARNYQADLEADESSADSDENQEEVEFTDDIEVLEEAEEKEETKDADN